MTHRLVRFVCLTANTYTLDPFARTPLAERSDEMKRLSATLAIALCTSAAFAVEPTSQPFGKTKDGKAVELYTLKSEKGLVAKVMTRGATLVQLHVPDANGKTEDVIWGFDDVSGYGHPSDKSLKFHDLFHRQDRRDLRIELLGRRHRDLFFFLRRRVVHPQAEHEPVQLSFR